MKHILVATDGSDHAKRAVDFAGDLAPRFDAKVTVLHVVTDVGTAVPPEFEAWARIEHVHLSRQEVLVDAAHRIVDDAEKRIRDLGVDDVETLVLVGNPAAAIVETARDKEADLIIMGRRGLSNLAGLFQGSVTHKVSHLADASVLTVR